MSVDSASSLLYTGSQPVDRQGMVSGLEQVPYAVLAVAGARVYHTRLDAKDSQQWNYSRWKGTLTFGRDIDTASTVAQGISEPEKHWFRLADDETGRTVWMFKFPENFDYVVDRPFFHVFQGRTRRYGFLFNDDDEAAVFGKKVFSQIYNGRASPSSQVGNLWAYLVNLLTSFETSELPKKSRKSGAVRSKSLSSPIARSLISSPAPNSFKHVAHVGVNKEGVFEASKDVDNSWKTMLAELQGHGVSEAVIIRHSDFVEGFWKGVEAVSNGDSSDAPNFDVPKAELTRRAVAVSAF